MKDTKTTKYDKEKIKKSLIKEGYDQEEIQKVLRGIDDIENGHVYSAEEIHKELLGNQKAYA